MLATISGPISTSFNSFSKLSWIQTTFLIGASVSQPLSGQLTDIYGRRKGLMACYGLFATGTLLCGLAPALWVFFLGRIIQGLGGGAIVSITAFVESDLVPLRKRSLIEGLGNIAYGITLALGGVYGGAINDAIGWKWAFLIQPPLILVDAIIVIFFIRIPQQKGESSKLRLIDYFGGSTLILATVLFQLAMNSGGSSAGWDSPVVIVSFTVAGISFGLFIFWDLMKATNPIIPIRALLQRTVASAQLSFFFSSAATVSILFYLPIYLQVLGHSTGQSGLRFIPMAIALAFASSMAGYIVKATGRYFYINLLVQFLSVLGTILLCTLTESTPSWVPFVYLGVFGLGYGGTAVTRLMATLSSVDADRQAVVQAASWTIESTGLAFGITVASTVFQRTINGNLRTLLRGKPDLLNAMTANFEAFSGLAGSEKQAVVNVYMKALKAVFLVAMVEMVLAAAIGLVMENNLLEPDIVETVQETGLAETEEGALKHG